MIRGLSQIAASTLIRLATGIFTFIYAASVWNAADFGAFMYGFSVSAMLVLCCEFGFTQQILRDVGVSPPSIGAIFSRFLAAKFFLAALLLILSLPVAALFFELRGELLLQFMLLLLAALFTSFSDLVLSALRALGAYGSEVRASTVSNTIAVTIFIGLIASGGSPTHLAIAFAIARLAQMLFFYRIFARPWINIRTVRNNLAVSDLMATLKAGCPYASDVFVGAALVNLDMILVARILGYVEAGVYQAAARLSQGVGVVFAVVASYFLPRMAAEAVNRDADRVITKRLFVVTAILGAMLMSGFFVAHIFYQSMPPGSPLNVSSALLPGFAVLVVPRLLSGSLGVILTAQGKQSIRAVLYAAALLIFAACAVVFVNRIGVWGVILSYGVTYSLLAIGFLAVSRKAVSRTVFITLILAIFVAAVATFLLVDYFG